MQDKVSNIFDKIISFFKKHYLLIILLALILIVKLYVLIAYNSKYFDDDQALVWAAIINYSHFNFREPYFFGQSYNFMFEAILAVPFYWIKVPLNYAAPLGAMICSLFPFIFVSIILYRKGAHKRAYCTLILYLCLGWQYEILASVPRAFLSGAPFGILGSYFLDNNKSRLKQSIGLFLLMLGVIFTYSVIFIALIAIIDYLLNYKYKKENILKSYGLAISFVLGVMTFVGMQLFYKLNPDYNLHNHGGFVFSFDVFVKNIKLLPTLLSSFVFCGAWWLIFIYLLPLGILIYKKRYKSLILIGASFLLFLLFMPLQKTLDFNDNILYCQARMFLCCAYIPPLIMYYDYLNYGSTNIQFKTDKKSVLLTVRISLYACLGIVFGLKSYYLINSVNDKNGILYTQDTIVKIQEVDKVKKAVDEVYNIVVDNKIDVVVTKNSKCLNYAFETRLYNKCLVYNINYERKTWVYRTLQQVHDYKVCFVEFYPNNEKMIETEIVEVKDKSVVDYIYERFHIKREDEKI